MRCYGEEGKLFIVESLDRSARVFGGEIVHGD